MKVHSEPRPQTTLHDTGDLDQYFQRAAALRLAIETNMRDFEFGQSGGRIVYLMDANVVRFFLDPVKERWQLEVFGTGNHDYASGTALVTAEFLFGRGLAGQGDLPALISPAHGIEVQAIAYALARTAKHDMQVTSELTPTLREGLQRLVDGTRSGQITLEEAAERLPEMVPDAAAQLLQGVLPANQLRRLHEEDLLRALALHPAATRSIMALDRIGLERKAAWTTRLIKERKSGQAPSNRSARTRVESDAEALVQLELLGEEADPAQMRYVLITADSTLFDAYARWYSEVRPSERPPFALRRLLQYVPILNIFEMPNDIEHSDILSRARLALDQALAGYREVDPRGYPQSLALTRVLAREGPGLASTMTQYFGYNPLRLRSIDRPRLEEVSHIWREGFRRSVVLNTQLMTRRLRTGLEPVEALLREQTGLREALHTVTRRLMASVERAHRRLNNVINLDYMASGGAPSPRAKPCIAPAFPALLGRLSLSEALDRLARGDAVLLAHIKEALEVAPATEACLFAACLELRWGHWFSGWDHAQRALELLESEVDPRWDEVAWLVAFAARYALPSAAALSTADELLQRLAARADAREDTLSLARAAAERAALILVLHYARHLKERLPDILPLVLPSAADYRAMTDAAREALTRTPDDAVAQQLDANALSAAALARVFGAVEFSPPDEALAAARSRLAAGPPLTPVLAAEAAMIDGTILPAKPMHDRILTELDHAEFDAFAACSVA